MNLTDWHKYRVSTRYILNNRGSVIMHSIKSSVWTEKKKKRWTKKYIYKNPWNHLLLETSGSGWLLWGVKQKHSKRNIADWAYFQHYTHLLNLLIYCISGLYYAILPLPISYLLQLYSLLQSSFCVSWERYIYIVNCYCRTLNCCTHWVGRCIMKTIICDIHLALWLSSSSSVRFREEWRQREKGCN